MIVYDARKLGGYDIFLHSMGSALFSCKTLPLAMASAALATVFAYAPGLRAWTEAHVLQSTSYFGSISFIVGFTVVYRSQIAYARYSEAQLAYFNMTSKMHDFVSFLNAFLHDDTERTQVIRDTLVRWARAYHELAMEEFQGIVFSVHDRVNLTSEEVELLARDRKRPIQLASWMHRLIMENRDAFKAGDAILSRAFQVQTNANMYFNMVRRIAETPFPFPFVQLTSVMIHIWAILTPIVTAAFFPESYILAGAIAGASSWILFGVNETAAQLELPFEPSANNLPVGFYMVAFDDDMSSVQYMEVPEVFVCCRENDFSALKTKSIHEPGPGAPGHQDGDEVLLPSVQHEPNMAASRPKENEGLNGHDNGEGRGRKLMGNFRFRNKLDAILEPEKEGPSSPQYHPRSGSMGTAPLRTGSMDSDIVQAPKTASASKLFDLFSLNRDDILRESGEGEYSDDDPSDAESNAGDDTAQVPQRRQSSGISSGAVAGDEAEDDDVDDDGDANTSHYRSTREDISSIGSGSDAKVSRAADEVRLDVRNEEEPASDDNSDIIHLPRRSSLPNSGLALDDSAIDTRIRNRHSGDEGVDTSEQRRIDNMDSRAILYHTVHGAEAKRMARDLQIEREIQRRAVANRALALQLRVDKQRYDMRHHLRNVPSLSAGDYEGTLGARSLDDILESRDHLSSSIGRSSTGNGEKELPHQDTSSQPRRESSRRSSHHDGEHTEHETLRSYGTLRRRLRGSYRKDKRPDFSNWPGWTTTNLTCLRSRGVFEVFK